MDGRRFDLLSRWVVSGSSRRTTLRALAAGVLTTGLGRLGLQVEDAAAKCTQIGKKCQSKHGKHAKCCGGAKCKGKRCKCPSGTIACNGACIAAECCDDSDCAPDGQCGNGACHFPPSCLGSSSGCTNSAQCCSGNCILPDTETCDLSAGGEPCHVDSDCETENCVLFVCGIAE